MAKLVFWSHWDENSNGTDYWEALGDYPGYETDDAVKRQADEDAWQYASDRFNWPSEAQQEEDGIECEGPGVCVEIYDPKVHDMQRSGGGSFADDFEKM